MHQALVQANQKQCPAAAIRAADPAARLPAGVLRRAADAAHRRRFLPSGSPPERLTSPFAVLRVPAVRCAVVPADCLAVPALRFAAASCAAALVDCLAGPANFAHGRAWLRHSAPARVRAPWRRAAVLPAIVDPLLHSPARAADPRDPDRG